MADLCGLASRAAYMYYLQGLSQKEVATRLALSTPTVCRLIKRAKTEGLVQISVSDPVTPYFDVEREIRSRYGLRDVVIARVPENAADATAKRTVAIEGADYLQRTVRDNDVVGVAWGSTVCELLKALSPVKTKTVNWVALHGTLSKALRGDSVQSLANAVTWRLNGTGKLMNIEGILDSADTASAVQRESSIQSVRYLHHRVTVSVVSIGALYPEVTSTLVATGYVGMHDLAELRRCGAVGDIVLRFFDQEGRECPTSLVKRTISIPLDAYRRIGTKIAVVSGTGKAVAVRAALRGGLIDVLITDPALAEKLLT